MPDRGFAGKVGRNLGRSKAKIDKKTREKSRFEFLKWPDFGEARGLP
jgi:hypothetical protein